MICPKFIMLGIPPSEVVEIRVGKVKIVGRWVPNSLIQFFITSYSIKRMVSTFHIEVPTPLKNLAQVIVRYIFFSWTNLQNNRGA